VQVIHSFDVPARRDLLFSLAAGVALLTVAAAQAVSAGFLGFVAVWLASTLIALGCSWRSMNGGKGGLSVIGLAAASVLVVVIGLGVEALLPPPRASQAISLPSSIISYLSLPNPGGLSEGGAHPAEPAKAGSAAGATRIGGYVGFAGPLDTAIRGSLGTSVVMRVKADRPGYFLGMTFNHWDGQSWTERAVGCRTKEISTGSPFVVASGASPGAPNVQTFYVNQSLPNLLFGTSVPDLVYFPDHDLYLGCDGSIRSAVAMTPGTVYTVVSADDEAPLPRLLRDHASPAAARAGVGGSALQLPHPYPRVRALARSIISRARATASIAARVAALEGWMAVHTRYSTDIPPLRPHEDAVDAFLFGSRVGYCEQISTALTVMLRSLGIPAREAIGYVPGPFDPLSDLYEIRADDAHAWVQVHIPGYGWQNFDPTAQVPLAPADPGTVLLSDVGHTLDGLPWAPIGGSLAFIGSGALVEVGRRRRRARPATWAARAAARLERLGARTGLPRGAAETLGEYGERLAERAPFRPGRKPAGSERIASVVAAVNEAAWRPPERDAAAVVASAPGATPAGNGGEAHVGRALDELAHLLRRRPWSAPRRAAAALRRGRERAPRRSSPPWREGA
ncbi:MAG: transglutaminaseTgpA domain-containing protein, partial [Acidimicrobiales bacterium]